MSEQPNPSAGPAQDHQTAIPEAQRPEPAESHDTTDWKAEARKWEARAKENRDAANRLQQLEDANKSETEKLTERATAAEQNANQWQTRYHEIVTKQAIMTAASEADSTDPETVYLYLRDHVQLDDDGNPHGIDKHLTALRDRKPHLFRAAPAGARDVFNPAGTPPALNSSALADALARAVGAN